MKIVPVKEIPLVEQISPVSTENQGDVMKLYAKFLQMVELCVEESGIGLSAVQVGIPEKMFVARQDTTWRCFLNCEYSPVEIEKQTSIEGCLSLRGIMGRDRKFKVERYPSVKVVGKEIKEDDGNLIVTDVDEVFDGLFGVVLQHEIDHHNGILISEIGTEFTLW